MSVEGIVRGLMDVHWRDPVLKAMKLQEYLDWIKTAAKGGRYTYHVGLSPQESFIAATVSSRIYQDYLDGLVFPFAIRKAPHIFEFIVVRTSKKYHQTGE